MSIVVQSKSNNSFFDDDDVPKNDVATSKQMEDIRELNKQSTNSGGMSTQCSDVDMQDSDGYETEIEQGISDHNSEDQYVIINVESYECVQISASSNYLQSFAADPSEENSENGDSSQKESSEEDTSDEDSMCPEAYAAYAMANADVYDTSDDDESSPSFTEDEGADDQCEDEAVNELAPENDNDDGPDSGGDEGSDEERTEMDSGRDIFASVEDAVTDDEDLISQNSDSPTEGRPAPSSDLSSRYNRYRTNVYGTDGEDLSTVIITKSYIDKNKADAMSEGAKTYGELMSALKRKRAAELMREAENADTTIVKVVKHRETVNERIKGKGKIARSASPFTAVATQPYTTDVDVSAYTTKVNTPEDSQSETNEVSEKHSDRSDLTMPNETRSASANRIDRGPSRSNIVNTENTKKTASPAIDARVTCVRVASKCSTVQKGQKEERNESNETPGISQIHKLNEQSVSMNSAHTESQLITHPNKTHKKVTTRTENTKHTVEITSDYKNPKQQRPAIPNKKLDVTRATNQISQANRKCARVQQQKRGGLRPKSERPVLAGNGVDLKKGPKAVLPAIGKKSAPTHIEATAITRQIQRVANLEQKISVGNIIRAAQPVLDNGARCRRESASERVPVQLKSDAYYRNGQLELSILGIERIYTTEPLSVKLTLLNKQHRHGDNGKNPYKRTTGRKQKKVARYVTRSLDTTNRDVIHQRALWPPFNTYTDPEASNRHEQFFHGGS